MARAGDFFVGEQGLASIWMRTSKDRLVKLKVLVSELDYSSFYGQGEG